MTPNIPDGVPENLGDGPKHPIDFDEATARADADYIGEQIGELCRAAQKKLGPERAMSAFLVAGMEVVASTCAQLYHNVQQVAPEPLAKLLTIDSAKMRFEHVIDVTLSELRKNDARKN